MWNCYVSCMSIAQYFNWNKANTTRRVDHAVTMAVTQGGSRIQAGGSWMLVLDFPDFFSVEPLLYIRLICGDLQWFSVFRQTVCRSYITCNLQSVVFRYFFSLQFAYRIDVHSKESTGLMEKVRKHTFLPVLDDHNDLLILRVHTKFQRLIRKFLA